VYSCSLDQLPWDSPQADPTSSHLMTKLVESLDYSLFESVIQLDD